MFLQIMCHHINIDNETLSYILVYLMMADQCIHMQWFISLSIQHSRQEYAHTCTKLTSSEVCLGHNCHRICKIDCLLFLCCLQTGWYVDHSLLHTLVLNTYFICNCILLHMFPASILLISNCTMACCTHYSSGLIYTLSKIGHVQATTIIQN